MSDNRRTSVYWVDSVFHAVCRAKACRRPVTMAQNARTGKWMLFDRDPVALRTDMRQETPGGALRQAMEVDLADTHFATCVDAARFRRDR